MHNEIVNDDKIVIEMYTESLCPDCIAFLKNSFSKAINTLNFFDIAELKLYPYGNAKESEASGLYQYTCQHGKNECFGNLIEVCALQHLD